MPPRERRRERKKPGLRTAPGDQAKERHLRDRNGVLHDWSAPLPKGLVARPDIRQPKSKHHSYFEFVENKEKKKKLDFQITTDKTPPPGYEFVPIGNPELTSACKELSREKGAMVFIVSNVTSGLAPELSLALNREGHHIRETIVEEARALLGEDGLDERQDGAEPIPESQEEINKQADDALRDLFPRMPHPDRQAIIERSFRKGATMGGKPLVGVNPDISLSRRAQLSVIAHIRHEYTRYDQLLRETSYANARKAVQPLCLDYILKWRGDEETGRDQLDEILREVVVISDTEGDDSDEEDDEDADEDTEDTDMAPADVSEDDTAVESPAAPALSTREQVQEQSASKAFADRQAPSNDAGAVETPANKSPEQKLTRRQRRVLQRDARRGPNRERRDFGRYQAVRDQAWQQARERRQRSQEQDTPRAQPSHMDTSRSNTHAPQPQAGQRQEPQGHYGAESSREYGFAPGPSSTVESRYGTARPSADFQYEVSRPPQNLQDYLVPSIEPASPSVGTDYRGQQRDASGRPYYPQGPWEVVPERQPHGTLPRGPAPYVHPDEPIFVRRLPEPRRVVQEPMLDYGVDGSRGSRYYEPAVSSSQSVRGYVTDDGAILRQHEPRLVARAQPYLPRHEVDQRGVSRRPVTFTETRGDNHESVHARGISRPIPLDGSYTPARQSYYVDDDAASGPSRPIVIRESPMSDNQSYNSRPPVAYARQEPEYIVIREAPGPQRTEPQNHRIMGLADPYPVRRVERSTPMEFVRVENSFPRRHGAAPSTEAVWAPSGEPHQHHQLPYRPAYERGPTQRPADPGVYPPRQERVLRVEYVDYELPSDGRGQPIYDDGRPQQQQQYRAATRPAPDAAYQQAPPPLRRDPRQDDVIYIE